MGIEESTCIELHCKSRKDSVGISWDPTRRDLVQVTTAINWNSKTNPELLMTPPPLVNNQCLRVSFYP